MRRWYENFMSGRYGTDNLSRFMLVICVILLVINLFTGSSILYILALALLVLSYYRTFSRKIVQRSSENDRYLEIVENIKSRFRRTGGRNVQSDEYRIYKCPSCGQKIRVPRGKGRICITCPKCHTEFQKRS